MSYVIATGKKMMAPPMGRPHVLLVTYDLKTAGWNYEPFYSALQNQGRWLHYISATWLISTQHTPETMHAALRPYLTDKDFILILPVTKPAFGFLPQDAWDWISANVP